MNTAAPRCAFVAWAVLVCGALLLACAPAEPVAVICAPLAERPDGVIIAGSGANLPLFRGLAMLAAEDMRADHGGEIVVPESIGTGGAIQALSDGAIDLGLASRPLRPDELAMGIREVPIARSELILAVHPRFEGAEMTWEALLKIAAGGPFAWPDETPAFVVHREPGDSGHRIVGERTPTLAAAFDAGRAGGGVVVFTDTDAIQALYDDPGAVAIIDAAAARMSVGPVAAVRITGAPDNAELVWQRDLSLLVPPQSEALAATFVESLRRPQAQMALPHLGYEILVEATP